MVIEDLLCVFFFQESWEREKKYRYFHSLTPFWDFHPKSNFSREKKLRHLCFSIHPMVTSWGKIGIQYSTSNHLFETRYSVFIWLSVNTTLIIGFYYFLLITLKWRFLRMICQAAFLNKTVWSQSFTFDI